LAVLLLVLGPAIPRSGAVITFPLTWRWSNPTPHGNNIIDIAGTNQFWIQVAEQGQLYTSGDLFNWLPRDTQTAADLRAVTFLGDQILVVGESGTVLFGPSVTALTLIDLGTTDWLEGVAASPQLAVAVGDNGAVYTSSDGLHWQRQNTPFTDWLRSVAFGTPGGVGTFVAVGESGFVATSTNGTHWQQQSTFTSSDLNRVSWCNGEFWTLGDAGAAFESTTGKTWVNSGTGATNVLNAFAGQDSLRLIAGDSEVRLRMGRPPWSDELATTKPYPPPDWTYLSGVGQSNSFLLCGRTGMMVQGVVDTNLNTGWSTISDSLRNWLFDMKRFPNLYLSVGDRATIMSSLDGINWDVELPPDALTNSIFLGIGGSTNVAVAVGSGGAIATSFDGQQSVVSTNSDGTLVTNLVSTLGIYWHAVQPSPTTNDLQGVTFFNDQFVVSGGSGIVLTSADAVTWKAHSTPTKSLLSSLEAFPGVIVAVGQQGTILTSPDAVTWTVRNSGTTNWVYRVRYLGGRLIALGENGIILTSTDAINWSAQTSPTTSWLNDVGWVDNTYFIVGDQGTVLTSLDSAVWTDRGTITGKSLFAAATAGGMLVAAGIEGVILRSQVVPFTTPVSFLSFPSQASDNVFLFAGQPGQRFTLDRSNDLGTWTPSPVLEIDTTGTLLHVDDGTNAVVRQFFRTSLHP
jgi:hypothetical protein